MPCRSAASSIPKRPKYLSLRGATATKQSRWTEHSRREIASLCSQSQKKSGAHHRAVFLPEAADRRLAGAEGLRLGLVAAHHHDAAALVIVLQCALHEAADAAVLK